MLKMPRYSLVTLSYRIDSVLCVSDFREEFILDLRRFVRNLMLNREGRKEDATRRNQFTPAIYKCRSQHVPVTASVISCRRPGFELPDIVPPTGVYKLLMLRT